MTTKELMSIGGVAFITLYLYDLAKKVNLLPFPEGYHGRVNYLGKLSAPTMRRQIQIQQLQNQLKQLGAQKRR